MEPHKTMYNRPPIPLVTLTTDFGTRDGYTGAMKGVIQRVAPHTRMVDITHEVPAGDIRSGAWTLRNAIPFFPRGTVHVAVIDPGVGTDRNALVVLADHHFLIGPDNGLFSWILEESDRSMAWKLSDDSWSPFSNSTTFHGRDLFSHAAALLVSEGDLSRVAGEEVQPLKADWAANVAVRDGAVGEVVHVDHFGNVITNLDPSQNDMEPGPIELSCRGSVFRGLHRTYGDVEEGGGLILTGSHSFLEIAVRQGSAAQRYGFQVGDPVQVKKL